MARKHWATRTVAYHNVESELNTLDEGGFTVFAILDGRQTSADRVTIVYYSEDKEGASAPTATIKPDR